MKHRTESETFTITPFNPKVLMPVSWLDEEWTQNRVFAWDVLNDEKTGLSRFERVAAPLVPIVLGVNVLLLILSLQAQAYIPGERTLGQVLLSPSVTISTLLVVFFTVLARKISSTAEKLRNTADSTVFMVVGLWIQRRYGLDFDYADALVAILSGEKVKKPESGVFLDTVMDDGEMALIVREQNGKEALVIG